MTSGIASAPGVRYVDAHCHIDLYPDPTAIMREAAEAGVGIVAVTNTPSVFEPMVRLAAGFSNVAVALGLHPELAAEREAELRLLPELIGKADFVGEIGLDGSSKELRSAEAQRRVLAAMLRAASEAGPKILTVHTRRAVRESFELIGREYQGAVILHWFTGTPTQMREAIERGWWFSVNPPMIATAKGRALIGSMPPGLVLTETDGPFARSSNGPCRPAHVVTVVDYLATLWRCGHEEARIRVLDNFRRCTAARAGSQVVRATWEDALLRDAPTEIPAAAVLSAIRELFRADRELFVRDVNERAITARLGEHLRLQFPGWDVDCEYNRDGHDVKRADAQNVVPDVIIHRRGTDHNLLVIEVKKSNSNESDEHDMSKLRAFKGFPLQYQGALFLKVLVGPTAPGVKAVQWV